MLRVALTGGIATGKSYVLDRLRALGVATVDADELAHGVTVAGSEATQKIAERFGPEVIAVDGSVDRRALGAVVFGDAQARRELEAIVHPAVYRAIAAAFRAFELVDHAPLAVAAIPLLYETRREKDFDVVIATVCRRSLQRERLIQRGLSGEEADQRIDAQMDGEEKAGRADYVIRTDGEFADTDARIEEVSRAIAVRAIPNS
ncbi:MAG TPA: dephospho-CoA kinase [Vicinamibacterales bacterium]|jgi:dephospho-CoA kinase|nr:dephospho-CoA kinase [Vicinamibacterales bacterium]